VPPPSPLFFLKTEAEPASETFFKEKSKKSKSKVLQNASHHHQNPPEQTCIPGYFQINYCNKIKKKATIKGMKTNLKLK
jgi:hypothetical protein